MSPLPPLDLRRGVLVVGAGPSGLTLALALARRGVPLRIVDKSAERSRHSKALAIHPRTLELLDLLDAVEPVLARCQPVFRIEPRSKGARLFALRFPDVDSPYPRPVILRQSETERILEEALAAHGVRVERNRALVDLEQDDDGVTAVVEGEGPPERVRCAYLAGCDGASSQVRKLLAVAFEGHTYDNDFLQADTHVDWDLAYDTGYGFFANDGALVALPLGQGMMRFIRVRQRRPPEAPDEPNLDEFQRELDRWGPKGARLHDPEWCVRFRLHERLAARFQVGRAFLVGDAAHIHTPAGGQGMNTGMQDAHNLGWKLHCVLGQGAPPSLLESYERERRPIAASVLRLTGLAFRVVLAGSALFLPVAAVLAPLLLKLAAVRRRLFRRLTQVDLHVRHGGLGLDKRGRFARRGPRVGDRAPDARLRRGQEEVRLFELARGPGALVVVQGDAAGAPEAAARLAELAGPRANVVVVRTEADGTPEALLDGQRELARRYALQAGEVLVVRPDGYVGLRAPRLDVQAAAAWLQRPGL